MSVTEPMPSSACMRVALLVKPQSMDRCDKLSVYQGKVLPIPNFLPSAINQRPLATTLLLSTARKVQVYLRTWLSMRPQTATRITVPIVTAAVTPNHHTDRTRKCTNRVIRNRFEKTVLRQRFPTLQISIALISTACLRSCLECLLPRLFLPRKETSPNDFPFWASLHYCRGSM
jgi:hypothetical protein